MTEIQQQLFALQDKQYRQFHSSLIPTLPPEKIIGVRMPAMRRLAKQLAKRSCIEAFMRTLPHEYYDENTLHGLILCEEKDYDKTIALLNWWLPFVDNWATCDLVQPRAFRLAAKQQPDRLSAVGGKHRTLHHPLWREYADDAFSGQSVPPRTVGTCGSHRERPLLCAYGGGVVFCYRLGKAVRGGFAIYRAAPPLRVDAPQDYSESHRELPRQRHPQGIPEDFPLKNNVSSIQLGDIKCMTN